MSAANSLGSQTIGPGWGQSDGELDLNVKSILCASLTSPLIAIAIATSAAGATHDPPVRVTMRPQGSVVIAHRGNQLPGPLPVDGSYRIGDVPDGRPMKWSSIDDRQAREARENVFLVPIAKDGSIIGFVRSDDFFAEPPAPQDSELEAFQGMTIVNETGRPIGRFVDGVPNIDGGG